MNEKCTYVRHQPSHHGVFGHMIKLKIDKKEVIFSFQLTDPFISQDCSQSDKKPDLQQNRGWFSVLSLETATVKASQLVFLGYRKENEVASAPLVE